MPNLFKRPLSPPLSKLFDRPSQSNGGGGTPARQVFVDSVNGSDANDGLAAITAKQTLAGARAIQLAGDNLTLMRGSYWREQYDVSVANLQISVAGSGDMPVIDGADIVTTGWTQPDAVTYPNVWSRSWTRASITSTASEMLGYWQAGVRTTRHTSLANLQAGANGDWHTTSLTTQTSTVSIRSASDPNSDGILREITKRHHGINGHSTPLGSAAPTGQNFVGPIEIRRCVGHYNALAAGPGVDKRMLLRDGTIHHSVSQASLSEDIIATEYSPDVAPSVFVAFQADGSAFDHIYRRCLALMPGGASRIADGNASAFYGHASLGAATMRNMAVEACLARGLTFGSLAAASFSITGGYCEDPYGIGVGATAASNVFRHMQVRDTVGPVATMSNRASFRRLSSAVAPTLDMDHCTAFALGNGADQGLRIANTYAATIAHSVIVAPNPMTGVSGEASTPAITNSVFWGGRSLNLIATGYTGDFNVFYFVGTTAAQFGYNGLTYNLGPFQAASGQDANSVFLKNTDQTASNPNAFWLGVSSGANAGPADGDFRINPNARVYNGAGTQLTGTFADGVTPITAAGPQEHWDWNLRSVVAGPPTRYPTLPATIAEYRTYLENQAGWNFYP